MSPMNQDCAFCEIVADRAPAHIIEEDDLALALLDINPFTEGHCLVVSKRHVPWWHELTDEEIGSVFRMAKRVAERLGAAFSPEFVCMYARGRRIPHTHIFLVPTMKGDLLDGFFNALERFQESPEALASIRRADALAASAEKIRRAREIT
jgi:histidine triad (HIT) family protein